MNYIGKKYIPTESTPVSILYSEGYNTTQEIADQLGVSRATIVKWDKEGVWPMCQLQALGFNLIYGSGFEMVKLKKIRDQLNSILEED